MRAGFMMATPYARGVINVQEIYTHHAQVLYTLRAHVDLRKLKFIACTAKAPNAGDF